MTKQLVMEANRLYIRSEAGIAALPISCRPGIFAARHIYAGIGREVQQVGYDSISTRAHTSKAQKIGWLMLAATRTATTAVMPRSAVLYARPIDEVAFLVDAAATRKPRRWTRQDGLIDALGRLAEMDRERREALMAVQGRSN